MSYEWKALANAIVHYQFNPNLSRIAIVCEKCKNEYMWIMYKEDAGIGGDFERFSVFLLLCPECGHVELDVIGTYDSTEVGWGLDSVINNIKRYFNKTEEMHGHVTSE
jgi:uncharacterized Zn finger protein